MIVRKINNLINKNMEITINALELASELAHDRTLYESGDICNNEDEMYNGENYTDEIQERFNQWYDYYLTKIEQCNTNKL